MTSEKILIGKSDYTRKEIESGNMGWSIGSTDKEFLRRILEYENDSYTVIFKTNIFRRIFGFGTYKVIAFK